MSLKSMYELINMITALTDKEKPQIDFYDFPDDGVTFQVRLSNGQDYFFGVN